MKGIFSVLIFAAFGYFVLQQMPAPTKAQTVVVDSVLTAPVINKVSPVTKLHHKLQEVPQQVPIYEQPVITKDKDTWPFGENTMFFTMVACMFVIVIVRHITKRNEIMGVKKTRRGALNFLYEHFRTNDIRITGAGNGIDELGPYDHFTGVDPHGRENNYFIEDTDKYPKDFPE